MKTFELDDVFLFVCFIYLSEEDIVKIRSVWFVWR